MLQETDYFEEGLDLVRQNQSVTKGLKEEIVFVWSGTCSEGQLKFKM